MWIRLMRLSISFLRSPLSTTSLMFNFRERRSLLLMLLKRTKHSISMASGSRSNSNTNNENDSQSIEDLYNIDLIPSELFLKFRKEVQGLRVGLNLEFYNYEGNDYEAKMVLKPMSPDRRWKFVFEPVHGDIRVPSKKIPINKYLNLQVGVGHNFHKNAIGWKWKLSSCWGGDGISKIRNKTSIGLFPGFDLRIGWKAEYILPEIHGGLGTGEPVIDMNYGRLNASLDRIEAIITHGKEP